MEDKITIIEGPPPTFQSANDAWALGLNESASLSDVMLTRLRTFNGPGLVERCYHAWHQQSTINLEFRDMEGFIHTAPILAARTLEHEEGQEIVLWVRLPNDEVELEFGYEDDQGDETDDDFGFPSL